MYKAYGKKRLQFSEQIIINSFVLEADKMTAKGKIIVEKEVTEYKISGEKIEDYYLVYAYEN